MQKRYKPQYILAILQLLIILMAKFWFLRAGSNDDASAFSWMYYPMAWILSQILGLWSGNHLEISYSGFVCNFDFRFASGSGGASLNGCSAGGLFLAVLGMSSVLALLWQRSRFAAQKATKYPQISDSQISDQAQEFSRAQSAATGWGTALFGLLLSYVFSFIVLLLYNLYVIFGSAALATQLILLRLKHPWLPHLSYSEMVKLLFVLCAALLFTLLCRKKAAKSFAHGQN